MLLATKTIYSLAPRSALAGGRVEVLSLYKSVKNKPDHFITMVDVNSLYPFCLKYSAFPFGGNYSIIRENFDYTLQNYTHTLISCQVLPPKNLFIPILPAKIQKK